jgi:hypothetical protein
MLVLPMLYGLTPWAGQMLGTALGWRIAATKRGFAEIIVENAAAVRMHIGQNVAIEEGLLRQATAVAQIDMHFDAT